MKLSFAFMFLILAIAASGQEKDYLVKHQGDTLYGNIHLQDGQFIVENKNTGRTSMPATEVQKVFSENIKGHIVVYGKLHQYTDDISELQFYNYDAKDRDTLMILNEVYSSPKMNLYWGVDNFKRQYYFYKTPTDPLPIQLYINYTLAGGMTAATEKGLIGDNARVHVQVQKGFANQLRLIMGDCKKITDGDWDLLDYREYSLRSVIKKFNKCK